MKKRFQVKTVFLYRCILELSIFENAYLAGLHIKEEKKAEARRDDTDEQPLSDKPPLILCGETHSTWQ